MCDAGQHIQHARRDRKRFVRKTWWTQFGRQRAHQSQCPADISKYINQVEICMCNDLTRSDWAGSVVWSEAPKHSRSVSLLISHQCLMCCMSDVRGGVRYRDLFLLTQSVCDDVQMPCSEESHEGPTVNTQEVWWTITSERGPSVSTSDSTLWTTNTGSTSSSCLNNLPQAVLCCQCPRTSHEQKSSHTWWVGLPLLLFPINNFKKNTIPEPQRMSPNRFV